MPRDFFRKASSGYSLVTGTVVTDLQLSLSAAGISLTSDSIYGSQTANAISAFQLAHDLPGSGNVSDVTWRALTRTPEPPIFERCLEVVASFEGTGFTLVVGNFDGAGITWGIVGFTLIGGELGSVLREINQSYPDLIGKAFGADAAEVMDITDPNTTNSEKAAWANSISRGAHNYNVVDPWRTYFHDLGSYREVQRIQIARARSTYWTIAARDAEALNLSEELDLLLLFDVAVQNGGMNRKGRLESVRDQFQQHPPKNGRARRTVIANAVADTITSGYRADVLSRKMTIASGSGEVHGAQYDLLDWGFLDGSSPTPALTS